MPQVIENTGNRKTYPQDWKAYNAAQTCEKELFLQLLHDLCAAVEEPQKQTNGRPRLPLNDAIFAICYKNYSTLSARRFMTDLRDAKDKGLISKAPHFNSILNYLENPSLTPILTDLIIQSSLPLAGIETDFAVDSSGFTSSTYSRWFDHKYGRKQKQDWVKIHLMCGTNTHIVTAADIKEKNTADAPMLPDLINTTSKNFQIKEVSADKGYVSLTNYAAINFHGATPYIRFKDNNLPGYGGLWDKMYYYFKFNQQEYMAHYHKRSNVETVFSMIKAKFGGYVRSKTEVAMKNEVLCKIICHNICVIIQEVHELGIEVGFSKKFMGDIHVS